jgi:hypothetical protein
MGVGCQSYATVEWLTDEDGVTPSTVYFENQLINEIYVYDRSFSLPFVVFVFGCSLLLIFTHLFLAIFAR